MADRRQLVKAKVRHRRTEKQPRDQAVLGETGIRKLRRQTVLTTPNQLLPPDSGQPEVNDDPEFREGVEPQNFRTRSAPYPECGGLFP